MMETKLETGIEHASVIFVCLKRTRIMVAANCLDRVDVLRPIVLNVFETKLIGQQNKNSKHSSVYGEK
jgi:hypothetical protein